MDRKRKSVFSKSGKGEKRKQTHHLEASSATLHPGDTPKEKSRIEDRINDLSGLVRNIIDDIQHEQDVDKISAPIKQATQDLNTALYHIELLAQRSSEHASNSVNSTTLSTNNIESGLPSLPLISDRVLERAVFTHPGVNSNIEATYDRLEILGDAYIELFATRLIWDKFHKIPSGQISQLRELLVKNDSLAQYALQYRLDSRANIPQDYVGQPKRWTKTMGDIFESYVAAVVLSDPTNGFSIAENWLRQLWLPKLKDASIPTSSLNAKDALARKIMGKGIKLKYLDERTPTHEGGKQTFFIGLYLSGWGWTNRYLGSGQGPNKAVAGNAAAEQVLNNKSLIGEVIHAKKLQEARSC